MIRRRTGPPCRPTGWVTPRPGRPALFAAAARRPSHSAADPTLTTEFVLLAVLDADPGPGATGRGRRPREDRRGAATTGPSRAARRRPRADVRVAEPTEHADAARVIDANLNRAREALRVLDDYCRFVLDDRI